MDNLLALNHVHKLQVLTHRHNLQMQSSHTQNTSETGTGPVSSSFSPTNGLLHPLVRFWNWLWLKEENIRYGSSDELIRHTLHGRINDILYTKKSIKLQDIFRLDSAERKVILVEGAPGSGKSTLAWHICTQWQTGHLFQDFHTVVFVQLRDPAIHSATSVEHILPATKRIQTAAVVEALQAIGGRGMLWVLDGWDELPLCLRTNSIFYQLIRDPASLDLNYSTILITSRPVASGDLYRSITSRIEILGFTPTEVKEYFTEALKGDLESVDKLQNYLKEQPVIEASCYIPINAVIVTHLFKAQNQSLPTTLHEVFTSLVIGCLIRHMMKEGEECPISSLDSLPSCLKEPFHKICALAYHQVMKNKATFSAGGLEATWTTTKIGYPGADSGCWELYIPTEECVLQFSAFIGAGIARFILYCQTTWKWRNGSI